MNPFLHFMNSPIWLWSSQEYFDKFANEIVWSYFGRHIFGLLFWIVVNSESWTDFKIPLLFNCSIGENIAYGASVDNVSDEDIEAVKLANAFLSSSFLWFHVLNGGVLQINIQSIRSWCWQSLWCQWEPRTYKI